MWIEGNAKLRLKYEHLLSPLDYVSCTFFSLVHHKSVFGGVFCQGEVKIYWCWFWFTNSWFDSNLIYVCLISIRFTSSQTDVFPVHKLSDWFISGSQALDLIWFQFTSSQFDLLLFWITSSWFDSYSQSLLILICKLSIWFDSVWFWFTSSQIDLIWVYFS